MGTELFRRRADPVGIGPLGYVTNGRDERDASRIQARDYGSAISNRAIAACHGLVRRPPQGPRIDLAARPAAPDRQTQFCQLEDPGHPCAPISLTSNCPRPALRYAR